jgi:hypothetical protein
VSSSFPDYLTVPAGRLGDGTGVRVDVLEGMEGVARHMADAMLEMIVDAHREGRAATLIVPVGPVDQFPVLAARINERKIDCRDVMLINMDEYLTDEDQWIPADHPLSFRGFMDRRFYDRIDDGLAPKPANRVFPHPDRCQEIQRMIDKREGVDACFGECCMVRSPPPARHHCCAGTTTRELQLLSCHSSQLKRSENSDFEPLEGLMLRQAATRGAQSGVAAAEAFRIHSAWKRIRAW